MGMAASQARYLALVARKSNCEWEGQQINQSRLALSNQSAEIFNQMMGMEVPHAPSKYDYTYTTYTFSDGDNDYTLTKWNHLADTSDGYNYVVTYSYDVNEPVGFQKYKRDPQIQYSGAVPTSQTSPSDQVRKITEALEVLRAAQAGASTAKTEYGNILAKAKKKVTYQDTATITGAKAVKNSTSYTVTNSSGNYSYINYNALADGAKKAQIKEYIDKLIEYGTFTKDEVGTVSDVVDYSKIYYNEATDSIAFDTNLDALVNSTTGTILPIYHVAMTSPGTDETYYSMEEMINKVNAAYEELIKDNNDVDAAQAAYDKVSKPIKIGNTKLVALSKSDITAEVSETISKVIAEMKAKEIDCTNLINCFNTLDGTYNADTYIGGLYSFDWTTNTYYSSYYDLYNSTINGTGINNIDDQSKLPYYGVQDADNAIVKECRALIEKDKTGRFTSIQLEDDSMTYKLAAKTETDDIAYQDAMSQYDYDKAMYDKRVQELNAKTSLIQTQDKDLELRLKQLDTEQNALATEIDAVSKVVKDNVEKSFKTFSG